MYRTRFKRVWKTLRSGKASHCIVARAENIRYLTGFRGDDSMLLLTRRGFALVTDMRYWEEAEAALKAPAREGLKVRAINRKRESVAEAAARLIGGGSPVICVEEDVMPVSRWKSVKRVLKKQLVSARFGTAGAAVEEARSIKDGGEIRQIRRAVRAAEKALADVREGLMPGLSERRVAMMLHTAMVEHGAEGPSFPIIVASGKGTSRPHHETSERKLRRNEPVLIDWGAKAGGYVSDLTRMFFMGKIPSAAAKAYETVISAQAEALKKVIAGEPVCEVDSAARRVIDKEYEGLFSHALGHGIGLEVHEQPILAPQRWELLAPGMVFTIEPGIYVAGRWGVRMEDDYLMTGDGAAKRLSTLPTSMEWAVVKR
ncbi:MAG TPA: M24 family metallopeptidase [Planctomycetes bacterium]|nr:M24 family metallopeptidase [Planctomycetota bacterium]